MPATNPTIVEIHATVDTDLEDENSAYYKRTLLTPHLTSTTKFDYVLYSHLGFHAWSHGLINIRRKDGLYVYTGLLEPNMDAILTITPFKIKLENIGDSFMAVHVRMKERVTRCKVTVLQEKYQPKAPKEIDSFIKYHNIWYATATINCLQTLRIEEMKGDSN